MQPAEAFEGALQRQWTIALTECALGGRLVRPHLGTELHDVPCRMVRPGVFEVDDPQTRVRTPQPVSWCEVPMTPRASA